MTVRCRPPTNVVLSRVRRGYTAWRFPAARRSGNRVGVSADALADRVSSVAGPIPGKGAVMKITTARKLIRSSACAALALLATAAQASFHLWVIDQIFSDSSGDLQYIELSTTASGQTFMAGHQLTASQGATQHIFTFPSDLAGNTANKKLLIATQAFANLPGLTPPDFIVPNGFLFLPGGTIDFASVDSVVYASLPSDGLTAINHAGTQVANTPTNYAGASSPILPPPAQAGPMDIDRNGHVDALTDGLLMLRYMLGLRGTALVQGAIGAGAGRNTHSLIEAYLATCIAGPGNNCQIPP